MNIPVSHLLAGKSRVLHTVSINVTVAEAVQKMNLHRIGAVLVMNGAKLAGIFTERDVLTRVVAAGLEPRSTPVAQVMTASVLSVLPETSLQQVMDLFAEKRCRHLPVIDAGELVGLVSIGDVSRWMANEHRAEAESLRQYIAGGLTT